MNTRMTRKRARIVEITKTELKFCSSRRIEATLHTKDNEIVKITWADTPAIILENETYISKAKDTFNEIWNKAKISDQVTLVHFDDVDYNYFYL